MRGDNIFSSTQETFSPPRLIILQRRSRNKKSPLRRGIRYRRYVASHGFQHFRSGFRVEKILFEDGFPGIPLIQISPISPAGSGRLYRRGSPLRSKSPPDQSTASVFIARAIADNAHNGFRHPIRRSKRTLKRSQNASFSCSDRLNKTSLPAGSVADRSLKAAVPQRTDHHRNTFGNGGAVLLHLPQKARALYFSTSTKVAPAETPPSPQYTGNRYETQALPSGDIIVTQCTLPGGVISSEAQV